MRLGDNNVRNCCGCGGWLERMEETGEEDDDVSSRDLNFEKLAQRKEMGGRKSKKRQSAEKELAKQNPLRLLGRDRNIKSNEHEHREPGSGNLISSRLGISGEKYREKKGGEKSVGDGQLRDPSFSFEGDDRNETEEDASSDEEARSGRGSSSTYKWLRRKRKDPTPSIEVVKCSIEGHQAETEVSQKQHAIGKGLARGGPQRSTLISI